MIKYSTQTKMNVVHDHLEKGYGLKLLANKYHIPSRETIRSWILQAQEQGIDSLKVDHIRHAYTQAYKLSVVRYVEEHDVGNAVTAAHFGISASNVAKWRRLVHQQGAAALRGSEDHVEAVRAMAKKKTIPTKSTNLVPDDKYKREIKRLKTQVEELKLELDVSKTLAAFSKMDKSKSPRK